MKLSLLNKKGSVNDYIIIPIVLIVIGFTSIFGYLILDQLLLGYESAGYITGDTVAVANNFRSALLLMDKVIVFVMVGMLAGIGYLNYRINSKPVFFVLNLIIMPFIGFISYFFNYLFIELISDGMFTTILTQFPLTLKLCTNLHWIALISFIIGTIALYGKGETGGDSVEPITTEDLQE